MKHEELILRAQVKILHLLLTESSGICTIDSISDGSDLRCKFTCGGNWRGRSIGELAKEGIIARIGSAPSKRKTRKGSHVTVWQLVDAELAFAKLVYLKRRLMALYPSDEQPPKPKQRQKRLGGGFDDE